MKKKFETRRICVYFPSDLWTRVCEYDELTKFGSPVMLARFLATYSLVYSCPIVSRESYTQDVKQMINITKDAYYMVNDYRHVNKLPSHKAAVMSLIESALNDLQKPCANQLN
jgi:hypothetical protein